MQWNIKEKEKKKKKKSTGAQSTGITFINVGLVANI